MEIKKKQETKNKTVQYGEYEKDFYLNRNELADFLRHLAQQLEEEEEIVISTNEWEIPFAYREPIEVEIEFEGEAGEEKELEIEIEFKSAREDELQLK